MSVNISQLFQFKNFHYGWLVLAVAFISCGLSMGAAAYSFGAFVSPLEREFHWSRTQINASLSFGAFAGLISPLVGRLLDRYGSRRVMTVSLVILAVSYLLRPYMTNLWHWYALSALLSIGFPGATILPAGRLVALWFPNTTGRMMGLTFVGNNVGGLVLAPLSAAVVSSVSWQAGFQVLGLLFLLGSLAALLIVRDDRKGFHKMTSQKKNPTVNHLESVVADLPRVTNNPEGFSVRKVLRTRQFYMLGLGLALGSFTYSAVLPQIVPHLENENISLGKASLMLSLMAAFGAVGKVTFGYLAERITVRYAVVLSIALQALGLVILINYVSSPILWLFLPIFGISFGGLGTLIPLIVHETYGVRRYGTMMGLIELTMTVPAVIGPLIVGSLVDITHSYNWGFLLVIGLFILGAIVLALTSPVRKFAV